jgi:hypothetical protein
MEFVYKPRWFLYDQDWQDAFTRAGFKGIDIHTKPKSDFVVFLHSVSAQWGKWPAWEKRGTWVALFANEFKHTHERMDDRFDYYGSQHTDKKAKELYGEKGFSCTWGLSPRYEPRNDWRTRPFDVGIVGNPYPAGHRRERIAQAFNGRLATDIVLDKKKFHACHKDWPARLTTYKAMPSTETVDGCMSARHMEAVGTHALNVVYDGQFSNVLTPEYRITLKDDHSNLDEVIDAIHTTDIREKARQYMIDHHTYDHRVAALLRHCA